jgi:hypothetical protein
MKKLIIVFMLVSVLALTAIVSYAQEENSYEEFKEVGNEKSTYTHYFFGLDYYLCSFGQ